MPEARKTGGPQATLAAILSLVLPGLGQIYARFWLLGLTLVAIELALTTAGRGLVHFAEPNPAATALLIASYPLDLLFRIGAAIHAAKSGLTRAGRARAAWPRSAWFTALCAVILAVSLVRLLPYRWQAFNIPSGSMLPTLEIGDVLFADKRHPDILPARGDIVVFHPPGQPDTDYIKRVIGLPGDRVALRAGILFLNGEAIPRHDEGEYADADSRMIVRRYTETLSGGRSYAILKRTDAGAYNNYAEITVPPGTLFTLGDNRDNSLDSRVPAPQGLGFIPQANLVGTARTIYWATNPARIGHTAD